jgi:hypothetical protein
MPSAALVILTPSLRDADLPIRLRHHGARCGSALRLSEDPPCGGGPVLLTRSTPGTSGQAGLGQQGPERRAKNRWLKPTFCTSPI